VTLHFAIVDQIDERGFQREISLDVGGIHEARPIGGSRFRGAAT
jgi:hypothetical protein